jgi:hypothetical protein
LLYLFPVFISCIYFLYLFPVFISCIYFLYLFAVFICCIYLLYVFAVFICCLYLLQQYTEDGDEASALEDLWLEGLYCSVCRTQDDDHQLLICDGCEAAVHTYCIGLDEIPESDWFCDVCQVARSQASSPSPISRAASGPRAIRSRRRRARGAPSNSESQSPPVRGGIRALNLPRREVVSFPIRLGQLSCDWTLVGEGDPEGWSALLVTALGSWEKETLRGGLRC